MNEASRETTPPSLFSATLWRMGLIPWLRFRAGTLHLFFPEWLYDLFVLAFFPINWVIAAIPARAPTGYSRKDWMLDPRLAPSRLPAPTTDLTELTSIIRRRDDTRLVDQDIWSLFDSLSAPTANDMMGNWRGKVLNTGSWLAFPRFFAEKPLGVLGLSWGKRFFTPYRGDPFILVLWSRVIIPVPTWGNVSMPEIRFRGKCGATMTYDHQPWKDYFRVLDDGQSSGQRMVLGNWMSREKLGGWFTLEEMPAMNEATSDLLLEVQERSMVGGDMAEEPKLCTLCGKTTDSLHHELEQQLMATIRRYNPEWVDADGGCAPCIEHYKNLEPDEPIV